MRFLTNLIASTLGALLALFIVFFFLIVLVFALAASSDDTPRIQSGSVLVVDMSGPIPEVVSNDPLTKALGGEQPYDLMDLKMALAKAAVDDRIAGVWLQMRGVSASWATLEEIHTALLDFKEESGKPLLASSDDYSMAEDEYFLASAADSVFASPQAFFEFNGFYLNVEFYKNLLDKLDVEPQIVRVGKFKAAVEPFFREDLSPENAEQLQALLGSINERFMQAVAESRGLTADALTHIASEAAILSPEDAKQAGLLDDLLYHDEVERLFKTRLGYEEAEDLPTVKIGAYVNVPAGEAGLEQGGDDEVAIVYAVGAIVSGKSRYDPNPIAGGQSVGAETFNDAMREAREADRVKAVVLRVNSPGGSAAAADAMWREIALTAEEKPVIVSMGDLAASGGYWIATAGDTIVADPLTLTGSIGVFSIFLDAGGLFENKLGITFDAVRTSPYADMFSGVRPLDESERALLADVTENTYQTFLQKVAESRGLDVGQVDSVAQGRIWSGAQALEIGLVDLLGDLDTAIALAAEKAGLKEGAYRIRILPRPKTFLDEIGEALNARASAAWLKLTTTPEERALMEQARALRTLLEGHATVQARLPINLTVQ